MRTRFTLLIPAVALATALGTALNSRLDADGLNSCGTVGA